MSRWQRRFAVLVLLELAAGLAAIAYFVTRPKIPAIDFDAVDAEVAQVIFGYQQMMTLSSSAYWQDLARLYLSYGYLPQAEICARQAAELDGNSKDSVYLWAVALDRLGRLDEAAEKLKQAMQKGITQASAWTRLGRIEMRREAAAEAEVALRAAVDKDPHAMPAAISLARLLLRTNRAAEVEALMKPFVEKESRSHAPCQMMALAELEQGRPAKADEWLLMADWRPDYSRFTDPLADAERWASFYGALSWATEYKAQAALGHQEQAAAAIQHALSLAWDEQLAIQAATAFLKAEHPQDALAVLRQVIPLAGRSDFTSYLRGEAYSSLGNKNLAVDAWSESVKFRPSKSAYERLAEFYGRQPDSQKEYLALALYGAGLNSYDAGNPEEAAHFLGGSVEFRPDQKLAWLLLGEARRVQGQNAAAREAYEHCLKIDPDQGRAQDALHALDSSKSESSESESS